MQLVAYGAQDIYLTGNPQITFFKVVYRRHTNFSMESIEQTFNGSTGFGKKVSCTVSRNGDLVHTVYLEVTLTDLQQKILSNDLYNDTDNAGLDDWIQKAVDGKISNCWKRMQREWTTKLMDDDSFTDAIPSNQKDFVDLVTARSDYKNRKARDDA